MTYLDCFKNVKPDPILGLAADYKNDPRDNKINLTAGVYKDEDSKISIFQAVLEAEKLLLQEKQNKGYPPIDGEKGYTDSILKLVFPNIDSKFFYVAHTVGATSALRLSGDLLKKMDIQNIYISDLTWPNHPQVFHFSGLNPLTFPYYNFENNSLQFEKICHSLQQIEKPSAVLFQLCCHNPTGRDFSSNEWDQIIQIIREKQLFLVIDCAYHGFGVSLEEDLEPLKKFTERLDEFFLCYSCAKNFGLYGERVGAFIAFSKNHEQTDKLGQNARQIIRGNYSTPPIHGSRIVKTILRSNELTSMWEQELNFMKKRIKDLRQKFSQTLSEATNTQKYNYILEDKGLFSMLKLTQKQVLKLRKEHGIYILDNGRINIAGLNASIIDEVCSSLATIASDE